MKREHLDLLFLGIFGACVATTATPRTATSVAALDGEPFILDVRSFGAVGDGIVDDGPAIAAALAAVPDQGAVVLVPPGSYRIASAPTTNCPAGIAALCPRSHTRIQGQGAATLVYAGGGLVYQGGGVDFQVNDLAFDASGAGSGAHLNFFAAVSFVGSSGVTVRGLRVKDTSGLPSAPGRHAVLIYGSDHVVVQGCNVSEGLRIKVGGPGSDVLVEGNFVAAANDNAITLAMFGVPETTARYVIRGNVIHGATGAAIYVGDDGAPGQLGDQRVSNVVIADNVIEGPMPAAILVKAAQTDSGGIAIIGNTVDNRATDKLPFSYGIRVTTQTAPGTQRAEHVAIVGNAVRGPWDIGAIALEQVSYATIADNAIDCQASAVAVYPTCNGAIFLNGAADVTITGNVGGNAGEGLEVRDSTGVVIVGNRFHDLAADGIRLFASPGITVSALLDGNVVSGAGGESLDQFPFSGGSYAVTLGTNVLP